MRSEKGLELHRQAEHTREAGDFAKSAELAREAVAVYEEDGDFLGASDACGSLSLSLRHQARTAENEGVRESFLREAEEAALKGIKIAEDHNLGGDRARPYFNLAKVQEDMGDFGKASESYHKSVEIFENQNPTLHNRSGVLADMKIHLATNEYRAGDKSALERAEKALLDLENPDEKKTGSVYTYLVWLSGGHMRIAEALKNDDLEKAKKHLEEAEEIIKGNIKIYPNLEIRKGQWEELSKSFL